ncbi:hypothetical protein, partial [Flavobacterium sp.]|uniref:beta strand repeat-containing protein n=1 Tax=Flavobacterium sp. TaxID=239 RepID=UPI0025E8E65C
MCKLFVKTASLLFHLKREERTFEFDMLHTRTSLNGNGVFSWSKNPVEAKLRKILVFKSGIQNSVMLFMSLFFVTASIGQTTYYYKGSGALNTVASWGIVSDGTGAAPLNFTSSSQIFNVRNTAAVSTSGNWLVSGTGSKISVGDGSAACNLTIIAGTNAINGIVDVAANGTLSITNTTIPSFGTLNAASTVVYNGAATQNITVVTYGNLTYSGTSTGTFAGSCNIAGSFNCSGTGSVIFNSSNQARTFAIGGSITMSSTGTVEFGGGNGNSTVNLTGNFLKNNGYIVSSSSSLNSVFNMVGVSHNMQSTGGTIMKWMDFLIASGNTCTLTGDFNMNGSAGLPMIFTVANGGTLNCGTFNVVGSATGNTFVLSSGAALGVGSSAGITIAGTASGNIQSLVRTYTSGANYIYNGVTNQALGNGFSQNIPGNLTISNTGSAGNNTVSLGASTTITGNVILAQGILSAGTNAFILGGDWINNVSAAAFISGTGTVSFNSTTLDQSIIGTASAQTFNNLTITKSAKKLIVGVSTATVGGTLTMTSGNIDCGLNTFELGTSIASVGTLTYTAGNIIGNFRRWFNSIGAKQFPFGTLAGVGTAAANRNALVTFTNLTNGSLSGKFIASDPGDIGLSLTENSFVIGNQFTEGYWSLTAANSLASTNYALELNGSGFSSFTEDANVRIIKRSSGGSWILDGTHSMAVTSIAKRGLMSGFGEFAHGRAYTCLTGVGAPTPASQSVCAGAVISGITVTSSGGSLPYNYQWFSNTVNANNGGTNLGSTNGAQTSTYTPPVTAVAGLTYYYCEVSQGGTICSTLTSATTSLTVNALPTNISPSGTATICSGISTNIQILNSQTGINYQLRNNSGNINVGTSVAGTGATINLPSGNLSSSTIFNVLATNVSSSCSLAMSGTVTVTVNPLPINKTVATTSPVCSGTGTNV